jgi:hypothetical protein
MSNITRLRKLERHVHKKDNPLEVVIVVFGNGPLEAPVVRSGVKVRYARFSDLQQEKNHN